MNVRLLARVCAAASVAAAALVVPSAVATAAPCTDVDVSFARGTGELPGLGITGGPFTSSVTSTLAGRSVSTYAVNYAADFSQASAGPGSRDLVAHITSVAAACPATQFIIGGYSQGATVVTNAVGLRTPSSLTGSVLPAGVADRVKAVVVFGNPFGLTGRTIESASGTYGPRARSFCNFGDPVCQIGGFNSFAHLTYASNGSAGQGATFAASRIS
ncbi:cutinase family protein [Rhodococcus sp. BP-149]|uniref:cutinase family protein n=1 Tax=unclassified Rhodococcus (in: high G+C Gram-positive bacteria) TaxID=192944 RepID=UPI0006FD0F79|nr:MULTISPECIES: cutinase family protein [unclassified Rhodococcus (in: high G+C Gram-positive bacteria)]KQU30577.1 cutinase [Rhodococcus sp. Leaf225]KQU44521.1 cutinase [Rhodococcus sp. Leaf258]MBY6675973.1 cutinase family protein [Rhodococcus sp. BP-332]MBY6683636.1 cutinase family protein [Rhodococcus sp. BP-316]MBY6685999.1 cutinase family protein [Rhodococcus sp. BP-288]